MGCGEDWGPTPITPHATRAGSREVAGFLARYDFGFAELTLAANENKGLLIVASFMTFRDGSARSSYFTREFFYRDLGAAVLPTPTFPLGNAGVPCRIWPETGINAGFGTKRIPTRLAKNAVKPLVGIN